jgi:WD40 repeat protein
MKCWPGNCEARTADEKTWIYSNTGLERCGGKRMRMTPIVAAFCTWLVTPCLEAQTPREFSGHEKAIEQVVFGPTAELLASRDDGGVIILWDTGKGSVAHRIPPLSSTNPVAGASKFDLVEVIALSPDGTVLAGLVRDGGRQTVKFWDARSAQEVRVFGDLTDGVDSMAFSPDGKCLALGDQPAPGPHGVVSFRDLKTGLVAKQIPVPIGWVRHVSFDAKARCLVAASFRGDLAVLDAESGAVKHRLKDDGYLVAVAVSPDGALLAAGGFDRAVGAMMSNNWLDETWMASAPAQTVTAWRVQDGSVLWRKKYGGLVTALAFDPDGTLLASGSTDGSIYLTEAATGKAAGSMKAQGGCVLSIALSADGRFLATAHSDCKLRLWDFKEVVQRAQKK